MRIRPSIRVLATTLIAMCASGAWPQPQTPDERSMSSRTGGASAKATPGAAALKWDFVMKVTGDDGMDAYVDHASIHRAGRVARMVSLWDFKSRQVEGGKPYLSARSNVEYDCDSMRFRILAAHGYADHMGRGPVTTSSDEPLRWQAINDGSVFHAQWKTACASS